MVHLRFNTRTRNKIAEKRRELGWEGDISLVHLRIAFPQVSGCWAVLAINSKPKSYAAA